MCTPGNNQCVCSWTAPSSGATSYNLKRSTHQRPVTPPSPARPATNHTDSTAVNGTNYFYVVSGVNGAGEGANSSPAVQCQPVLPQPPMAPSDLIVVGGVGQAQLDWIDNASNETGTRIERKLTVDPDTSFALITTVGANVQSYLDTPLAAGDYTWRVQAINAAGASSTPTPPPPP